MTSDKLKAILYTSKRDDARARSLDHLFKKAERKGDTHIKPAPWVEQAMPGLPHIRLLTKPGKRLARARVCAIMQEEYHNTGSIAGAWMAGCRLAGKSWH